MRCAARGGSSLDLRTCVDKKCFVRASEHRCVIVTIAIGPPPRFTVLRLEKHAALLTAAAVALNNPAATCPSQARANDLQITAERNEQTLGKPLWRRRDDNDAIATGDVLFESFHPIIKPMQPSQAALETRCEGFNALVRCGAIKSERGNPQQDGRARVSCRGNVQEDQRERKDGQHDNQLPWRLPKQAANPGNR